MKKEFVFLAFVLLLCSCSQKEELVFPNANVIIVGLDTVRPDRLAVYGYDRNTTPLLNEFAEQSYVFANAVTQAPWTLPSFMSMFTSLYPHQHELTNRYLLQPNTEELKEVSLSPDIVTLAETLKGCGYKTAAFTGDAGLLGRYGFSRGFEVYYDTKSFDGFNKTAKMAAEWLKLHHNESFFLFVHGYEAHGKYKLPENFSGSFFTAQEAKSYNISPARWLYYRNLSVYKKKFNLSRKELGAWRDWYDEKLRLLDSDIEPLFSAIKEFNLTNRTIFVFMSDHGDGYMEHGTFDHGLSLYDELLKVVLFIRLPGQVQGKKISQQVRLIDITPTVLKLLGLNNNKLSNQAKGVSIIPILQGRDLKLNACSETDYLYNFFYRSIRSSDGWKLIYSPESESYELYNLKEDPNETINLVKAKYNKFQELREKLFKCLS